MTHRWIALLVGFIFGSGLALSGMTQPQRVIGFLDVLGAWDPSLMFVMGGAFMTFFSVRIFFKHRKKPFFSEIWHLSQQSKITPALAVGSALFGAGWGLAGYCPGPALVSTAGGSIQAFIFVGSMIAGMVLFRFFNIFAKLER